MLTTLLQPWRRGQTLWSLGHVLLDVWLGAVTFTIIFTLLVTSLALVIVLPLAIPVAWALFVGARLLATVERTRFAALLDLDLADRSGPLQGSSVWRRFIERLTSKSRWLEIAYLLLLLPLGCLTFAVAIIAWCGSLALLTLRAYVGAVPGDSAKFWLFDISAGPGGAPRRPPPGPRRHRLSSLPPPNCHCFCPLSGQNQWQLASRVGGWPLPHRSSSWSTPTRSPGGGGRRRRSRNCGMRSTTSGPPPPTSPSR